MKRIHVMAAVIERGNDILIARRPDHVHQGGKWEFPGGKLETGEAPFAGLVREIQEELGITVSDARPLICISHDYPDKQVMLDVWRVQGFTGEPVGQEGQEVRWVSRDALGDFEFPAANVPIVSAVQLPPVYVISPDMDSLDAFVAELEATLVSGARLIQIRIFGIDHDDWEMLLSHLQQMKQTFAATFLLNSSTARDCLDDKGLPDVFSGMHLTATDLQAMQPRPAGCRWLAASCHSIEEIIKAQKLGADFVTLSPVQATRSHPDAELLGWETFASWVERATLPVFGLGGLTAQDVARLQSCGAQGAAGISGFWKKI